MMQLDAVAEYLTEWGVVERCVAAARLLSGVLDCCGLEFLTRAPTLGTLSVHGPAACAALASANAHVWLAQQSRRRCPALGCMPLCNVSSGNHNAFRIGCSVCATCLLQKLH